MNQCKNIVGALLLAVPAWTALPLLAQTDDGASAVKESRQSRNRLLEEVVVTARKREESSEDIPIAIAAFSEDKLDAIGIESAQQLDKITPGLVFSSVIGFNTVFLRGVGSDAYLPSADPSVPVYVDDISALPSQGSIDALVNVERVEVLKGPQGTLFGRNALGGAIRIVTPDPDTQDFFGKLKLEQARYDVHGADAFTGSAFLNIPLGDSLAATVSGLYRDEEPYYRNQLGYDVADNSLKAARLKVKWYVTDALDVTLSGSYEEATTPGGLAAEGPDPSPILCGACTADPAFDYETQHNVPASLRSRRSLFSSYINWDLPLFTAKLILSDQRLDVPYGFGDLDYTSSPLFVGNVGTQYAEQQTAEFRLESNDNTPGADKLSWVAGLYYLDSAGGYDPLLLRFVTNGLAAIPDNPLIGVLDTVAPGLLANLGDRDLTLTTSGILETESISGFAEGNLAVTDRLSFTLGLRYDEESRIVKGSEVDILLDENTAIPFSRFDVPEATTSRTSPRVSAQWFFDESQVYASYSIGYLSPTYNTVNLFEPPDFVKQEEDHAYEIGFKGNWLSGSVQLEAALFFTQRYDIITAYTSLTSGGAVNFYNAGDGEVKGAEFSLQLQPLPTLNPGLVVIAGASFLDGEYTDFPNGQGYDDDTGLTFGDGATSTQPPRDFTGNEIVQTPDVTAVMTIVQALPLGDLGDLELAVDGYYNSGYYFSAQNTSRLEQDSYHTFDARISYFYLPWGLQLTAFGQNITDERYFASAVLNDFGPGLSLAAPRQFGMRAKWEF